MIYSKKAISSMYTNIHTNKNGKSISKKEQYFITALYFLVFRKYKQNKDMSSSLFIFEKEDTKVRELTLYHKNSEIILSFNNNNEQIILNKTSDPVYYNNLHHYLYTTSKSLDNTPQENKKEKVKAVNKTADKYKDDFGKPLFGYMPKEALNTVSKVM